jgi:hypothetical protein
MNYQAKTVPLVDDLQAHLNQLSPKQQHEAQILIDLFQTVTGEAPVLWRGGMIGFGSYHYTYATGHEGDALSCGFAIRKTNITLYLLTDAYLHPEREDRLLEKLGAVQGKSCFYVKRLEAIDLEVLSQLIKRSMVLLEELKVSFERYRR